MKNGKVKCHKCSNEVSPRLWHNDMNSFVFKRSNQHICPVCGITMYSTGGGLTAIGILVFGFFGLFLFGRIINGFYEILGFSRSFSGKLTVITLIGIAIWYLNKRTSVVTKTWLYLKNNNKS